MIFSGTPRRRFMSDINVVPLVDVVLVLLVIFMITAPLLYRGIEVDLPRSTTNTIVPTKRVVLTVSKQQTVFVDEKEVSLNQLQKTLEDLKGGSPEMTIYLRGDEDASYGLIVQVMDIIKKVGIDRLGMVTEPVRSASGKKA
jgi:biopolymer transport protein TolR